MLFVIGGEGANKMAAQLSEWCDRENVPCCIVGVPKSIENDMLLIDRCFGFDSAVEEAQRPLHSAKTEASSARKGIGIVKVTLCTQQWRADMHGSNARARTVLKLFGVCTLPYHTLWVWLMLCAAYSWGAPVVYVDIWVQHRVPVHMELSCVCCFVVLISCQP